MLLRSSSRVEAPFNTVMMSGLFECPSGGIGPEGKRPLSIPFSFSGILGDPRVYSF